MKNLRLLLMALLMIFLLSCSGSDDNNENTNPNPKQYKILLTGNAITNTCDVSTNSYAIKAEYTSDGVIIDSNTFNGSNNQSISDETTTGGTNLAVKLTLNNFDINNQNIGRGTGIQSVTIKVIDVETEEVLVNKTGIALFICTDSYYQADLTYNTETGVLSSNILRHDF
ncbi:hypothetical protein [Flavobacterium sp. N3904]|uniref:hypothetical protein n=1 Tax=Flavobacterium sp. N3904 TaxID=2986835 RepID=UPI002224155E|nr:hypothetical protein [Flavobacterium sp. N3904]